MITAVREKIRPKDYEAEIQKLNDEPKSIYPRILELPKDEKQSCKRATFHPDTKQVEGFSK